MNKNTNLSTGNSIVAHGEAILNSNTKLATLIEEQTLIIFTDPELGPCPPRTATNDGINVYRFVKSDPPTDLDFLSTKSEYPHRDFKPQEKCIAHGVSVFMTKTEALKKQQRFKNLAIKLLAYGYIPKENGVYLETGYEHLTWWIKNPYAHINFQVI